MTTDIMDGASEKRLSFKDLLLVSRPVFWIITLGGFAAGYLVAARETSFVFWLGTCYFTLPYNLLVNGINDIFDYESDRINPRKGGIEGALISPDKFGQLTLWIVAINLPLLGVLWMTATPSARLWLVAMILAALAYSVKYVRFKEIPLLDSMTASFQFLAPLVLAFFLTQWQSEFLPAVMAFALWGMAQQSFGAAQDMEIDRSVNSPTIATFLGAKTTTILSTLLYLAAAATIAVAYGPPGIAAAAFLALYALNTARFITVRNLELFNMGWRLILKLNFVVGIIVGILLIIALK